MELETVINIIVVDAKNAARLKKPIAPVEKLIEQPTTKRIRKKSKNKKPDMLQPIVNKKPHIKKCIVIHIVSNDKQTLLAGAKKIPIRYAIIIPTGVPASETPLSKTLIAKLS